MLDAWIIVVVSIFAAIGKHASFGPNPGRNLSTKPIRSAHSALPYNEATTDLTDCQRGTSPPSVEPTRLDQVPTRPSPSNDEG